MYNNHHITWIFMKDLPKTQIYERAGIVSIEEVLHYIWKNMDDPKKSGKVLISEHLVNVQSVRLRTFALTGLKCACCDLSGQFFAIERNNNQPGYHLNLWAINANNEEILMTHDHKQARALGGDDTTANTETMCGPCNWEKGKLEHTLKNNPEDKNCSNELNNFKKNKLKI